MNAIFTRRSVRTFLNKDIESVKIERTLRAAMQAPSAANQQAWKFLVVKGREKLSELSKYNPYAECLKNANIGIIVLWDKSKMILPEHWEQDLGAATQNILLEATEQGLGSVWLGTAPNKDRMKYIQKLYELDETLIPYSVVALGYPQDKSTNYFIDRFDENNVCYL